MTSPSIFDFQSPGEFLNAVFEFKKQARPSYSLTQFGNKLGFLDKGALSRILNGHRILSMNKAVQIAEGLELPRHEHLYFYQMIVLQEVPAEIRAELLATFAKNIHPPTFESNLDEDEFEALSDFHHLAVRECLRIYKGTNFIEDFPQIWKLPGPLPDLEKTLVTLEQLNLVKKVDDQWRPHDDQPLQYQPAARSLSAQNYHSGWLDMSKSAMSELPVEARNIQSSMICIAEEAYEEVLRQLKTLHQNLISMSTSKTSKRVIQVGTIVLPVGATDEN